MFSCYQHINLVKSVQESKLLQEIKASEQEYKYDLRVSFFIFVAINMGMSILQSILLIKKSNHKRHAMLTTLEVDQHS